MAAELISISSMQEIEDTMQFFVLYAEQIKNKRPHNPLLSKFTFLENIEIDEKLTFSDSLDTSKIPMEANIKKVCINCGGPFKTRFPEINICSLKCKKKFSK